MTEEQRTNLTLEERQRLETAEATALEMLCRKMREGRRTPRRHQQLVAFVVFALFALFFIAWLIAYIIGGL
jgi:hypothetical protein